jgi:aerobic-type carbon monoxide dehydrogenase small subunit (CoxS/CutS family)
MTGHGTSVSETGFATRFLGRRLHYFQADLLIPRTGDHSGSSGPGACMVLVAGGRICSCLTLAVQYVGREITTIEGGADSVSRFDEGQLQVL